MLDSLSRMLKPSVMPSRTEYLRDRIRRLKLRQPVRIAKDDISPREQQAWYHAARVEGSRVCFKTLRDGVWITRMQ